MENNVLETILNNILGDSFGGVFSKGEIITFRDDKYFVYNDAEKPHPGHFISLYYKDKTLYVFDSLAKKNIPIYLRQRIGKVVNIVKRRLQSTYTQICGLYCIYFCWKHFKKYTFKQIMSPFSHSFDHNDRLLYIWYNSNRHFFRKFKKLYLINSNNITKTITKICTKDLLARIK